MGQMSAGIKAHAHDGVTRLTDCHGDGHIGLCTGMRLNIGILGTEDLLGTLNGNGLYFVDNLAAAIVTLARITLGVLVGKYSAHGKSSGLTDNVLGSNELNVVLLAVILSLDAGADLGVVGLNEVHDVFDHLDILL